MTALVSLVVASVIILDVARLWLTETDMMFVAYACVMGNRNRHDVFLVHMHSRNAIANTCFCFK